MGRGLIELNQARRGVLFMVSREGVSPGLSEGPRRLFVGSAEALVLYEVGADGPRVVAANEAAAGLLGRRASTLVGTPLSEVVAVPSREREAERRLAEIVHAGGIWRPEAPAWILHPSVERLPARLCASRAKAGEAALGLLALTPLECGSSSAAGALEGPGLAAFERFAELSDALAFVVALDGSIVWARGAWDEVLGVSRESLVGQSIDAWLDPNDRARLNPRLGRLARGDVLDFEAGLNPREGAPRRMAWRLLLSDGLIHGTARDAAPAPARALAGPSPHVTGKGAKDAFLAHISHEVRTPLTAILGYAELARERSRAEADPELDGYLDAILRNGEHLLGLIGDVLELSRLESGDADVRISACHLPGLVGEVVARASGRALAKGLSLSVEIDPGLPAFARTDPGRLRQILLHLVGNALTFTERGGARLKVSEASAGELARGASPGWIRVEVSDTGIGMEAWEVSRLFEPFHRTEGARRRALGGAGLGLAISRRLAEQIGGRLSARSHPGQGSVFTLEFPAESPTEIVPLAPPHSPQATCSDAPPPPTMVAAQTPTAAAAVPSGASPRIEARVLLAEDSRDNQRVVSLRLAVAGAQVTIAPDGHAAVELARAARDAGTPFELILMDMQMPILDGYEATRQLRAEGFRTPIVAITAYAMPEDRQECLRFGCDGYISKPIDWPALLALLARLLEASRAPQAARLGA